MQMAEGGRKENDENRKEKKSFADENRHNFDENVEESEAEAMKGLVFGVPDLGVPLKCRERLVADEDKLPQLKDVENPFSFRHFLNKDQIGTSENQMKRGLTGSGSVIESGNSATHHMADRSEHSSSGQDDDCSGKPPRVAPEFASGLPDFVQDHLIQDNYSAFHENGNAAEGHITDNPSQCHNSGMYHQEVASALLPDFTPPKSSATGISSPLVIKSSSSVSSRQVLVVGPSCKPKTTRKIPGVSQKSDAASGSGNSSGSLPDFLSDGPMLSNHTDFASATPRNPCSQRHKAQSQTNDDDTDDATCEIMTRREVHSLVEDRNELRRKLDETRQLLTLETDAVCELRKEVEILRRKEVDETVALEHIVDQVEANLQSTTQRAVNSETIIYKLRQEIKTLQSEVSHLKAENLSLRSSDDNVIKRAKKASEQITEAANTAEHQLKQLISGLDSLRLISAVLLDLDRITETDTEISASGNV